MVLELIASAGLFAEEHSRGKKKGGDRGGQQPAAKGMMMQAQSCIKKPRRRPDEPNPDEPFFE